MSQPSVVQYFSNRKRTAIDETKINRAKKILLLDSSSTLNNPKSEQNGPCFEDTTTDLISSKDAHNQINRKLQSKEEIANKIATHLKAAKSLLRTSKTKKTSKVVPNQQNIQDLLGGMSKKQQHEMTETEIRAEESEIVHESHVTPPTTPTKQIKLHEALVGPSIKQIKAKITRNARLKACINRYQDGVKELNEIEKKTSIIPATIKLKNFKTIELEVQTSPSKVYSPEKAYLSPKKDATARRNLIHLLSPTKNAVAALPSSPSKQILEETSKPALTLPFKYRYLAEMFRSIDTVAQILHNRKETITFKKLKPAVEEMLKRNLFERHLAQIKFIYPDAFTFTQEKLRVYGASHKREEWELVLGLTVDKMTSDKLLERRRKLFSTLLDKVKDYHSEFLATLIPPMHINKDKITRWHPEFNIEKLPDIEQAPIPQPPIQEAFTSGKDVLEKARIMFNCNTRMENALIKLQEAKEKNPNLIKEEVKAPASVLKGIPQALLEKVRQKQAAKALVSMTRSADKEKEVLMYSRLAELARLLRILFVSEKKGVLPLDVVVEKMGNCYRSFLSKMDMEEHLRLIAKEVPGWLVFHNIRHADFLKLAKNADVSIVISKLETLAKQKSEGK